MTVTGTSTTRRPVRMALNSKYGSSSYVLSQSCHRSILPSSNIQRVEDARRRRPRRAGCEEPSGEEPAASACRTASMRTHDLLVQEALSPTRQATVRQERTVARDKVHVIRIVSEDGKWMVGQSQNRGGAADGEADERGQEQHRGARSRHFRTRRPGHAHDSCGEVGAGCRKSITARAFQFA